MITLKQLNEINTLDDLKALGIGNPVVDISNRGGGVGFRADDIVQAFNVHSGYIPRNFGCGCNYLGGGVRGAITRSGFASQYITGKKAALLNALSDACIRVYEDIENDNGMNDVEDEDGNTNWEALATVRSRKANIKSAY